MFRNKLLNLIESYQHGLETTQGLLNSERNVERNNGALQVVSIKILRTADWDAAEKFRQFVKIDLSDLHDVGAIMKVYPVLLAKRFALDGRLLAKTAKLATQVLDMDQLEIDASVKGMQLASLGVQNNSGFFGGFTEMDNIDFNVRMKYIQSRLPVLGAQSGDQIEMQSVGGFKL